MSMSNNKVIVLVVLTLVTIAFLFSGCSGKITDSNADPAANVDASPNADASVTPASSSGSDIGKDVITVAVDDTYPPMEYRDDNNNLVGFDIDFANALSEKLGVKFEFKSIAWDGIFEGLKSENYDCIISSVSMTPEKMETFDFTKPYLANGQVIVVKPGDNSIKAPADLAGKSVGVQVNTTSDIACTKQLDKTKFELKRYDDIIQTFDAMSAGHIDCIVVDYAVAIDYQHKSPDKYAISTAQLTNEPIAVCFKKGSPLRDKFQKALDVIKSEGKLSEFSKKWFYGEDYTSNIDENLY
jgi:polar amino acid transport system substrate-binding protein